MADIKNMKGMSEADRKMIEQGESLMGADPTEMGLAKNYFFGRIREDLMFPYPDLTPAGEKAACDQMLAEVSRYLREEHPATLIDQEQHIPEWVLRRLFELGVMGMTIPKEFGGSGMGITSYNRVLELIGSHCASTAVLVSAHQSIGCKAVMLFGTERQKREWLPKLGQEWVSAFCLSEPNVGCDAGGQETRIEPSEDGEHFVITGEKKWATSGAISGLFTVMGKQKMPGGKDRVTAVVCTPDMEGVEIYSKNRSKCGIRGTWQARIRFHGVKVPKWHLLHQEGKGLQVALTCLNYGRCTLSAGMLGGARTAMDQATKWARSRYQFGRAIGDFEQVKEKVARMQAYVFAMDAMLYATTGFLDRGDEDIRVETAMCKTFCSEHGWRAVNDAMQIMGGESYMTENRVERIFRDSRINTIVEGANEVMQQFVFGWGSRQMAEGLLGLREAAKTRWFDPRLALQGIPVALEVFGGIRRRPTNLKTLHPSLAEEGKRLAKHFSELTYQVKRAGMRYDAKMVSAQCAQARLGDACIYLHAWACTLSKLDELVRAHERGERNGTEFARDESAARHFFDLAELETRARFRAMYEHADASLHTAADAAYANIDERDPGEFVIPEKTPGELFGKGKTPSQDGIKQFPGDAAGEAVAGGTGREHMARTIGAPAGGVE